jgi:hypothetical protein
MKKLSCTLGLSLCAFRAFAAADAPETATAVSSAAAPQRPAFELKAKSSFALDESARNPFWPIGWKPAAVRTGPIEQVGTEIQASAFLVSSITVDTTGRYAIINGKVMNEGQVFGLQLGNQTYHMTVKAIQDGQVIIQRGRDQQIAVPLRRR